MKRLILFLAGFVPLAAAAAGPSISVPRMVASSGGSGSTADILFYSNCDTVTNGQSPQKGSGTLTVGASVLSAAAQISNGWDNQNGGFSSHRVAFPSASNINLSKGRVGFYFFPRETGSGSDGDIFWLDSSTGTGQSKFWFTNNIGTISWNYKNKTMTFSLTVNTWQFVELAWDSAETTLGTACQAWVNGVSQGTCGTGSTGADPAGTNLEVGSTDGNGYSSITDQLIISNDPTRDLNAVKNNTSF